MNKTIDRIFFALLFTFALAMSSSVIGQGQASQKMICDRAPYGNFNDPNTCGDRTPILTLKVSKGDIALEIVGQVQNVPATPLSNQYGYVSAISGIDSVFSSSTHNEGTALFTFYTEAHTDSVINNGKLRIVDRTGTTTIYFDEAPNGNFNDPNTFRDGRPILTMTLKQQVILDVVEGTFTTVNVNAVNEASSFLIGGDKFQLGGEHDQFRTLINGRTNDTGTPAGFVIAGYIVPIEDDKH